MSVKIYSKVLTEEDSEMLKVWKGAKDYHICMEDAQATLVTDVQCSCGNIIDTYIPCGLCTICRVASMPIEKPIVDLFYCYDTDEFVTEEDIAAWPDDYEEDFRHMLATTVNVWEEPKTKIMYEPPDIDNIEMDEEHIQKIQDAIDVVNNLIQELEPPLYRPAFSRPEIRDFL